MKTEIKELSCEN